jgi:hypothetical protein
MILLLSGCLAPVPEPTSTVLAPYRIQPEENPYAPKPGDDAMQIGGVKMVSVGLLERFDLDPFRVQVKFTGSLPSVCYELRLRVSPPNADFEVHIEAYSLINPNINCDNVFQQFEATILLGVYSTGRFTVWVNNGLIGDFVTY